MRFPVTTTGITFMAAGEPRPETKYNSTEAQLKDGQQVHSLEVVAIGVEGAENIKVKVAGRPDVAPATEIKITGLAAIPYDRDRNKCVSFFADRIEPATKLAKAS